MADLKPVYRAATIEAAEIALDELEEKWGAKYPIVIKSWRKKWPNLSGCPKTEIRFWLSLPAKVVVAEQKICRWAG